jgi:hypothetical protein
MSMMILLLLLLMMMMQLRPIYAAATVDLVIKRHPKATVRM